MGTQFDLKQATGFETLSVVPMNTLLLIKEKELKAQRLQMLSVVLLPIQRALITPLRIFHQRSLLPSEANFVRSLKFTPLSVGFFIV